MITEQNIYFSSSFYGHPGNGQIKDQGFKKKAFNGDVKINGFKEIHLYLKCTLIYIWFIGNFWLKKIKFKNIGLKIISFKCENRTKIKNKLNYDFFTLLKFPTKSLPFSFWAACVSMT